MKRVLLLIIFVPYVISLSHAQELSYGFQTHFSIPVQQFERKADGLLFPEFNFAFYHRLNQLPFELGLNLGYGIYGSKLERRNDLYEGSNDEFRLRRNNNILTIMPTIRYQFPLESPVLPFFEAQIGANYYYTRFKIRETIFSEPIEIGRDMRDWNMAYRVGGGLKIPIKKANGHLEIRAFYHDGTSTNFLRKQDSSYNPLERNFEYNIQRSAIQKIQFGIGYIIHAY